MSTVGWKKILTTPMPGNDWDSMCSMSLTVVESNAFVGRDFCPAMSSGDKPV